MISYPRRLLPIFFLSGGLIVAPTAFAQSPKICAIYPHLKDAYWLSVHHGMVEYAQKHQINLKIFEAKGYQQNRAAQKQWQRCLEWQSDAILLGMPIDAPSAQTPVFTFINTPKSATQAQHIGSDWRRMGKKMGQYLAKKHPPHSPTVYASLLLGPEKLTTSQAFYAGLKSALTNSSVQILAKDWGDTDKETQRDLWLKQWSEHSAKLNYVLANAVAAEVVVSHQSQQENEGNIAVLSTYLTHGVYRGLKRGKIAYALNNHPAKQGKMALKTAIATLQKTPISTKPTFPIDELAPAYLPTLSELNLAPLETDPNYRLEFSATKKR